MSKTRVAMLVSGGGRTLENLVERCRTGEVAAEVVGAIASGPGAYALERATRLGVPTRVVRPRDHADPATLGEATFAWLRELEAEWVLFGGYLSFILPPTDFAGRVLNIHPALIPSFCGKGMYGHHVHEAVLASGVEVTGCTVHFVDEQYDHGPILHQRAVEVLPGDTPDTLAARVFEAEKEAYPHALDMLLRGRARLQGARVVRS